jgi:hypothetical protein
MAFSSFDGLTTGQVAGVIAVGIFVGTIQLMFDFAGIND